MGENKLKKIFNPGPRGKLRWAVFGILVLFVFSYLVDISGFGNVLAKKTDQTISAVPIVNSLPVWPKIEANEFDGSKSLKFKSIRDIDLENYGFNFSLGLDLLGGTHLVYEADVTQIEAAEQTDSLAGVRDVIERRVNAFGVSEPLVQTNKVGESWRVIVELAGVHDVNQAIEMIGETPLLEFKEENPESQITPEQEEQLKAENAKVKTTAEDVLQQILKGGDFAALAGQYSEDPGSKDNGGLYEGVTKGMFVPEYDDVIFGELDDGQVHPFLVETQFGYHIIKKETERGVGDEKEVDTRHILFKTKTVYDLGIPVEPEWINTELTGKQLKKASVEFDPNSGVPQVSLIFDGEGSDLFAEITERNVGKPVAIYLDGYPISVPRVNEPILSGQAVITGSFNLAEAKLLAQRLNAGALPVPINLISQTTVGASLGNESVQKSLMAGILGLILVMIFMILYYRVPGILSAIALLIYVVIILALFKLIPVTLTLAGIAGFILSVGLAVDANVLIFERMKEELKAGKSLSASVDEGFKRAWSSIRDSNVSSLITCFILFWFGTSIIQGFALTLGIGIVISMFSAITITRQFLRLISKWKIGKNKWLFGVK